MAFVISDRIKMTTTGTGTGTLTLGSAVTGFQAFSAIADGNTATYAIIAVDANGVPTGDWETGIGTYTSSGTTLSRGVIKSSNSNALVSFSAGTKYVICSDIAGYTTPLVMATTANRAIQVADQTAVSSTAGNARGKAAVDLQIKRTSASQVASGQYATIAGGRNNTSSTYDSFVGGGTTNNASGYQSTICGGISNTATTNSATVCGGNTNHSTGSFCFIGSGYANTASGPKSSIVGGRGNVASAGYSSILGGYKNTASTSYYTAVIAGKYNTASGTYAIVLGGTRAKANKFAQITQASGRFTADGDAQTSVLTFRKQTTTNTQAECFLDNSSARLNIASDTTWGFDCLIVARRTDADNESSFWRIVGCIDNNAGTTALVGSITITTIADDSSAAWSVTAVADDTNDALIFKVTGVNSKTINWVGRVTLVEVTG